ncbi:hypothetical protein GI364_22940 [Alicyclobacillus sp. SO9]|nr:hypothetical protein GI364_22940 [Alicyclobacillus sp. SO9]
MDRDAKTCQLSGQHFGGSWNIRDKDPRRAGSSQAVSITLGVFILIMFLVESGVSVSTWLMHSPGPSPAVKANVVQQLCIPWILAGIFVRFLLSWKYPNIMLLRRNGKRLWVQFKD